MNLTPVDIFDCPVLLLKYWSIVRLLPGIDVANRSRPALFGAG
jgi:hypothetical protein